MLFTCPGIGWPSSWWASWEEAWNNLPLAWSLSRPKVPRLDAWLWIPPSPTTPLTSCPSPPNFSSLLGLHFFLACTLVLSFFPTMLFLAPPSSHPLRAWHIKPPLSCSHLFPDVASGTNLPHSFSASLALVQLDTIHPLCDLGPVTFCRSQSSQLQEWGRSFLISWPELGNRIYSNTSTICEELPGDSGLLRGRICTDIAPLWGVMLHLQEVALLCHMKYSPASPGRDESFSLLPGRSTMEGAKPQAVTNTGWYQDLKHSPGHLGQRGEAGGWCRRDGGDLLSVMVQGPSEPHYSPLPHRQRHLGLEGAMGWIVSISNLCVEALTPSTSKGDIIQK